MRRARRRTRASSPPEVLRHGTHPPPVGPAPNESPPQASRSTDIPRHSDSAPNPPSDSPSNLPTTTRQPPQNPLRSLLRPQPPTLITPGFHTSPTPQWSQPRGNSFRQDMTSPTNEPTTGKGQPPRRPPRPKFVPPLLSPTELGGEEQLIHPSLRPQRELEQNPMEGINFNFSRSDSTSITRGLDRSSKDAGPRAQDFPLPTVVPLFSQVPRRSGSLGPPPSARKGPYYMQNTFVAPIPEELSEGHSSFASSHVIPTSWGDGPPDSFMEEGIEEEDEVKLVTQGTEEAPLSELAELSKTTRQNSKGRRSRGSSKEFISGDVPGTWVKPPGNLAQGLPHGDNHTRWVSAEPGPSASSEFGRLADQHDQKQLVGIGHGTTFLSPPSGNSSPGISPTSPTNGSFPSRSTTNASFTTRYSGSRTPLDPRVAQILGSLEKGGPYGTSSTTSPFPSTAPSTSDKTSKRPPRLDIAAAREGEVRGSQSSLPELIRRATKLASNLDRGKTASRLGLLDVLNASGKAGRGTDPNSISDILAAFPSPSVGTPSGGRRSPRWASPAVKQSHPRGPETMSDFPRRLVDEDPPGRRCCGMPAWAFGLLFIVLVLLIAAAIVIPVTLIVLPRQRNSSPTTLSGCIKDHPCNNGGTNILINKACRCVCAYGFTGSTCSVSADRSCTNIDVTVDQSGITYRNATVGTGIPRLFSDAEKNYRIPLDQETLLSLFSSTNLSCSDENNLITFNSKFQRRSIPLQYAIPHLLNIIEEPLPSPSIHFKPVTTPCAPNTLYPRDISPPFKSDVGVADDMDQGGAVTSNNIVLAIPTNVPSNVAGGNQNTTPLPTAAGAPSPSSTNQARVPPKAVDFARIIVLFILQEKSRSAQNQALNIAVAAQERLQTVLEDANKYNATPVSAGELIEVDFAKFTVDWGNGTIFGNGLEGL